MFLASTLIMAIQIGVFAYMWYHHFEKNMLRHYWHRGNYVIIAQYALLLFLFYKLYGGFKVGYLRVFEVLYSQILSVLCVNFITYLQLALIGHWKFGRNINYLLQMTGINLIVVVIWVFFHALGLCKTLSAQTDADDLWQIQPKGSGEEDRYTGR